MRRNNSSLIVFFFFVLLLLPVPPTHVACSHEADEQRFVHDTAAQRDGAEGHRRSLGRVLPLGVGPGGAEGEKGGKGGVHRFTSERVHCVLVDRSSTSPS